MGAVRATCRRLGCSEPVAEGSGTLAMCPRHLAAYLQEHAAQLAGRSARAEVMGSEAFRDK